MLLCLYHNKKILRIKERLKHADVQTTLGTYGHLYLNSLREITNDPTDYIQTNFSKIKPTPIYDNKK